MEIPSRSTASKIQIGASQIQLYYYGPWVFDSEGGCLTCNTNCESGGYGSGIWPAGPIVTPAWCVLQIKSMLSCVDSIKLSSVKQSRSHKGGSKEPSRTLTTSLTAMHALCGHALRGPGSPARDPSHGRSRLFGDTRTLRLHLDPSPCPCNTQPPPRPTPKHTRILRSRDRPRVGDLSNLEPCLGPLPLPLPLPFPRFGPGPTASESALISGPSLTVMFNVACAGDSEVRS